MVYDSLCVGLYLKTAFGQVDIANDFRQIISATLLWHIPKFHSSYICVTLRPIKLLYSFLESAHNLRIVHINGAKVVIYFVKAIRIRLFFADYCIKSANSARKAKRKALKCDSITLLLPIHADVVTALYILTIATGYICLMMAGLWMSRLLKHHLMEDVFNNENESFQQETRLMENEYSVNLPTRFYYI